MVTFFEVDAEFGVVVLLKKHVDRINREVVISNAGLNCRSILFHYQIIFNIEIITLQTSAASNVFLTF
jgi:hypothetical protein